jgi:hypothetical protein
MSQMRPRQQDFFGELDELELGGRVADALFEEMFSGIYSTVKDRAWGIVLQCYRRMVFAVGQDNVPAQWKPTFDERGRWQLPKGKTTRWTLVNDAGGETLLADTEDAVKARYFAASRETPKLNLYLESPSGDQYEWNANRTPPGWDQIG